MLGEVKPRTQSTRRPTKKAHEPQRTPRRRRSADEARRAILDAAEARLVNSGPDGIRLQEVAADVGMSHPTVLHHFGSREALVREVCERRFASIRADLAEAMMRSAGGAKDLGDMFESVAAAVRVNGHARVVFWLALSGHLDHDAQEARMAPIGGLAQELRIRNRGGGRVPLEDTLFTLSAATLVVLAEAVIGPVILRDLGLAGDEATAARFRTWFSELVADHLLHGPRPAPANVR
jgi:AcrR family transcriptional regulator